MVRAGGRIRDLVFHSRLNVSGRHSAATELSSMIAVFVFACPMGRVPSTPSPNRVNFLWTIFRLRFETAPGGKVTAQRFPA